MLIVRKNQEKNTTYMRIKSFFKKSLYSPRLSSQSLRALLFAIMKISGFVNTSITSNSFLIVHFVTSVTPGHHLKLAKIFPLS